MKKNTLIMVSFGIASLALILVMVVVLAVVFGSPDQETGDSGNLDSIPSLVLLLSFFVFAGCWSAWSTWGECEIRCDSSDGGRQTRHRTLDNPVSNDCLGMTNEEAICRMSDEQLEICSGVFLSKRTFFWHLLEQTFFLHFRQQLLGQLATMV